MNMIKTNLKTADTLSDLLRVKLSEDSLSSFDPKSAVKHFLSSGKGLRRPQGYVSRSHSDVGLCSDDEVRVVE